MTSSGIELCRRTIEQHSRSFALASRLLPQPCRDDAVVLYAWCRAADDAVDLAGAEQQPRALERLRADLDSVYRGDGQSDPVLAAFQHVADGRGIPREYPEELLRGMEMDVANTRYATLQQLFLYCFRVAGVVGLMMCHVMGVRERRALRHAAHLGMAMQLTNICRDVVEDWQRGRLYIPEDVLAASGAAGLGAELGQPLPDASRAPVARAVRALLAEAERLYRSGDVGLPMLSWRTAFAARTARWFYADIGKRIARREYDVFAGRAYVPAAEKLLLVLSALSRTPGELAADLRHGFSPAALVGALRFPEDVLPV